MKKVNVSLFCVSTTFCVQPNQLLLVFLIVKLFLGLIETQTPSFPFCSSFASSLLINFLCSANLWHYQPWHVRPGNWRMIQVMKDSRYNWASWEGIKSRMMSNLFFFNSWCYYMKSSEYKWHKRRIIFHGDTDGKCFVYIQLTKVIFKKKNTLNNSYAELRNNFKIQGTNL